MRDGVSGLFALLRSRDVLAANPACAENRLDAREAADLPVGVNGSRAVAANARLAVGARRDDLADEGEHGRAAIRGELDKPIR